MKSVKCLRTVSNRLTCQTQRKKMMSDMSDSEEEDDVLEVSIWIDECRSLVEVASFPFFV